jgi:hypothetical protein
MMMNVKLMVIVTAVTAIMSQTHVDADEPQNEQSRSGVRIGTFDSRAVAIAYYRSTEFQKVLGEMRAKQSEARETGDSGAVQQLEAEGRRLQDLINRQGFGNATIGDVIKQIEYELPKVSERAGVDVIVSRWDVVFQKSDATFVDVTDRLVQQFKPDKETLEVIAKVRKTKPVPVNELQVDQ